MGREIWDRETRDKVLGVELVDIDLWNTIIGDAMLNLGVREGQYTQFDSRLVNLCNGLVYIFEGVDVMGSNTL